MLIDKHLLILPECYIDERLCQLLLQVEKVNHKKGFGDIATAFRTGSMVDKPALAVIDRDKIKGKSDFFRDGKNFTLIKILPNLSLNQRKDKPDHYCIIVEPDMEGFLMAAANEVGITAKDFSFLTDWDSFTSESKAKEIYKNVEFKRFVNQLVEKESETILTLKKWLKEFYETRKIEV